MATKNTGQGQRTGGSVKARGAPDRQARNQAEPDARFRDIVDRCVDAIVNVDLAGTITFASPAVEGITGFPWHELVGRPFSEFLPRRKDRRAAAAFATVAAGGVVKGLELEAIRKDGTAVFVEANCSPIYDDARVVGLQAVYRDISDRHQAEAALRRRERVHRERLESLVDALLETDSEGHLTYASSRVLDVFGFPPEQVVGRNIAEFVHPDDVAVVAEAMSVARGGEPIVGVEFRARHAAGHYVPVSASGRLVLDGDKPKFIAALRDISERKRLEEELALHRDRLESLVQERTSQLRAANERLRLEVEERGKTESERAEAQTRLGSVIQAAPLILWDVDSDGEILLSEGRGLEGLGLRPGELVGQSVFGAYKEYPQVVDVIRRALAGDDTPVETEVGGRAWLNSFSPRCDSGGRISGMIGVSMDITEQNKADQASRRSEQLYRELFESSQDGIAAYDAQENLIGANQALQDMLGYTLEELKEIGLRDLTPRKWWAVDDAALSTQVGERGHSDEYEKEYLTKGGATIRVTIRRWSVTDDRGQLAGLWSVVRDVTEQWRASRRIERLNRLLRARYSVSQLVSREWDRDRLAGSVCQTLVSTRAYEHAWTVFWEQGRKHLAMAESGLGADFIPVAKRLRRRGLTRCGKLAEDRRGVIVVPESSSLCDRCSLAEVHRGAMVMTTLLEQEGHAYGLLSVAVPEGHIDEAQESDAFQSVATDVAFAVHSIGAENQRRRAVDTLIKMARLL